MIREIAASKAAKLIAACVCPVAGTTALTLGVPQVRSAVHRATAPRAKALPRVRERAPVQVAQAAVPCYSAPALAGAMPPIDTVDFTSLAALPGATPIPASYTPIGGGAGVPIAIGGPGGGGGIPGTPGDPAAPPIVPFVPEPTTWVQLVLGFAVVGGAARLKPRRQDALGGDPSAGSEGPLA